MTDQETEETVDLADRLAAAEACIAELRHRVEVLEGMRSAAQPKSAAPPMTNLGASRYATFGDPTPSGRLQRL